MPVAAHSDLSLFGSEGSRKYLNAPERVRFLAVADRAAPDVRLFCRMLCLSGGRISEVLALTPAAIDFDAGTANFATLKRRKKGVVRQVPLPLSLLSDLDLAFQIRERKARHPECERRIWRWSRTTAWRRVKDIMQVAEVTGSAAMPKGLRHGFGVAAFQSLVPGHLVQRWLGHASLRTTAIYGDVIGADERMFAERMWLPVEHQRRDWRRTLFNTPGALLLVIGLLILIAAHS